MNHRKIKRGFGKLGIFCLGLVLALAVCGVGYAHWSDTLSIEGTIITGEWSYGCSHGFWKKHADEWPTAYLPNDNFDKTFSDDTFECDAFDPDITLMDALELGGGGGGLGALARQAVAALRSAAHPDVDYELTVGEVMDKVQWAIDEKEYEFVKDELEGYNTCSAGGCPL